MRGKDLSDPGQSQELHSCAGHGFWPGSAGFHTLGGESESGSVSLSCSWPLDGMFGEVWMKPLTGIAADHQHSSRAKLMFTQAG